MDEEEKKARQEEKKAEKTIEKATAKDTPEGDKPKALTIVEQANIAAERMEAANKKAEELYDKQAELMAKQMLGGTAEAGAQPVKTKETDEEYAARFLRGEANPLEDDAKQEVSRK